MWLALILLPSAHAEVAACLPTGVVESAPAPGATDVPLDARLTLGFAEGGCETAIDLVVRLARVESDGALTEVQVDTVTSVPGQAVTLEVDGGLEPTTDYRVVIDHPVAPNEFGFRTGLVDSAPLEGALRADEPIGEWFPSDGNLIFTVEVRPVVDPHALSVVGLLDHDDETVVLTRRLVANPTVLLHTSWIEPELPDEACAWAAQWDGAGRQVGELLEVCGTPRRERGCASLGGAPPWLALLALLGIRRARPEPA